MSTTSTRRKTLTADEFYRLPGPPEGGKMELIDGKVKVMAPVGGEHSLVAGDFYDALRRFVRPRNLGQVHLELGYRLRSNPDLVRAPDVSFIAAERLPSERFATYFDGPPTLAIEVLSPDDRPGEVLRKVSDYLDAGTATVWVAAPRTRTLTVYRQDGSVQSFSEGETLTSAEAGFAEPGFAARVADLFA